MDEFSMHTRPITPRPEDCVFADRRPSCQCRDPLRRRPASARRGHRGERLTRCDEINADRQQQHQRQPGGRTRKTAMLVDLNLPRWDGARRARQQPRLTQTIASRPLHFCANFNRSVSPARQNVRPSETTCAFGNAHKRGYESYEGRVVRVV